RHLQAAVDQAAGASWGRRSRGAGGRGPEGRNRMAHPKLARLLILFALVPGACGSRPDDLARNSVTVELPPARPATPRPGFKAEFSNKVEMPADDHAAAAVKGLAATL